MRMLEETCLSFRRGRVDRLFITKLDINQVRHLSGISIPFSENEMKHLILTGKNGSGKTSVVEAMAEYLRNVFRDEHFTDKEDWLLSCQSSKKVRNNMDRMNR